MMVAKATAALEDRDYIIPDDVKGCRAARAAPSRDDEAGSRT